MLDTMNVQNKLNDLVELMKLQMETGISFCGREYFFEPIFGDDPFEVIGWMFSTDNGNWEKKIYSKDVKIVLGTKLHGVTLLENLDKMEFV